MEIIKHQGYSEGALRATNDVEIIFLRYEENGPQSNYYAVYEERVFNIHRHTDATTGIDTISGLQVFPVRFELKGMDKDIFSERWTAAKAEAKANPFDKWGNFNYRSGSARDAQYWV